MSSYANRATKELITTLAGCVGFADKLQNAEYRNCKKARRSVKAMLNHAQKALDAVVDGLDQDEMEYCIRFANNSELMVMPQSDPRLKKEYHIVPSDALSALIGNAAYDCAFCSLTKGEIKKCRIRRAFLRAGITAPNNDEKDCPFSGGALFEAIREMDS